MKQINGFDYIKFLKYIGKHSIHKQPKGKHICNAPNMTVNFVIKQRAI